MARPSLACAPAAMFCKLADNIYLAQGFDCGGLCSPRLTVCVHVLTSCLACDTHRQDVRKLADLCLHLAVPVGDPVDQSWAIPVLGGLIGVTLFPIPSKHT